MAAAPLTNKKEGRSKRSKHHCPKILKHYDELFGSSSPPQQCQEWPENLSLIHMTPEKVASESMACERLVQDEYWKVSFEMDYAAAEEWAATTTIKSYDELFSRHVQSNMSTNKYVFGMHKRKLHTSFDQTTTSENIEKNEPPVKRAARSWKFENGKRQRIAHRLDADIHAMRRSLTTSNEAWLEKKSASPKKVRANSSRVRKF